MRRYILSLYLIASLALAACSRQLITAAPPTLAPVNPRTASLSEIVNIVLARLSLAEPLAQVQPGFVLGAGGQIQTGDESRARLDFSDGTLVRLASNSSFTMQDVVPSDEGLFTSLKLEAGKIWVSLTGGVLEVETPVGVAAVRGSFAVFTYLTRDPADPNDDWLVVDCLEGACHAENDVAVADLGNLQRTVLTRAGQFNFPLVGEDVQDFIRNNPEVADVVVATLTAAPPPTETLAPTATSTPSPPPSPTPEGAPTATATNTAAPTPTALPLPTAAPGALFPIIGVHTVQPGETIFCIGRAYGVLPTAITQVNGVITLRPGQQLRIPGVQWPSIPPGPVCQTQFTSPFPGLTPTNTPAPAPSVTPAPPTERPERPPTNTPVPPSVPSHTPTKTSTAVTPSTATATPTPSATPPPLATATPTPSATPPPTATATKISSATPSPTATTTKIPSVTPPPTITPSLTPSQTPPPTNTPTHTPTFPPPTFTPTPPPTNTPTPTPDIVGPSIVGLSATPPVLDGSTCRVTFSVNVNDPSGVSAANVSWTSFNSSGVLFQSGVVNLSGPSTGGIWSGTQDFTVPPFGRVGWTVSASDALFNPSGPVSGPSIGETTGYGCNW